MQKRGIFIVIDGVDGSGKQTQKDLLIERFKKEGLPLETVSFPRYGNPAASSVEKYLQGKYPGKLLPEQASLFFAADRLDWSLTIGEPTIASGTNIVADRYVLSNMGHQGGKINNFELRRLFFGWENDLEFGALQLVRPDLNIILHIPATMSEALVTSRGAAKDIHEADPEHLRRAEETYLELAQIMPKTKLIECAPEGTMLSREAVHELVWTEVRQQLER